MLKSFSIARIPRILFGEGRLREVPSLVYLYGRQILLVTGGSSFRSSGHRDQLLNDLAVKGISWQEFIVRGEPAPAMVDEAVARCYRMGIDVVVGIGGGSVLDAAKAIAGLLLHGNSVMDHLEGVGRGVPYKGPSIPFIAIPTTGGTGSEATKNAVLGVRGTDGFKKSFRHEQLVPEIAVVDPLLHASCPSEVTASCGMDALTQLIESYVSIHANPFTDALALSGIQAVKQGLFQSWEGNAKGWTAMAYAALLSGITLAHAGLGIVHGLASPLGALFPIPHGVACGTLLAPATEINIRALKQRVPDSPALAKYAKIGTLLGDSPPEKTKDACSLLIRVLSDWTERLRLPMLGDYGVDVPHLPALVSNSGLKANPVRLADLEIEEILRKRL